MQRSTRNQLAYFSGWWAIYYVSMVVVSVVIDRSGGFSPVTLLAVIPASFLRLAYALQLAIVPAFRDVKIWLARAVSNIETRIATADRAWRCLWCGLLTGLIDLPLTAIPVVAIIYAWDWLSPSIVVDIVSSLLIAIVVAITSFISPVLGDKLLSVDESKAKNEFSG
jgi:hypothetical protein